MKRTISKASQAWKEHNVDEARATTVFDNGRRGEPRNGCDCVQCFGYCLDNQGFMPADGGNAINIGAHTAHIDDMSIDNVIIADTVIARGHGPDSDE